MSEKALGVEVCVGNGCVPEWRVVQVQPGWDPPRLCSHVLTVLGLENNGQASCFSVRNRLEKISTLSQVRDGDRLLITPDGMPPVPYSVLGCGSNRAGQLGLLKQTSSTDSESPNGAGESTPYFEYPRKLGASLIGSLPQNNNVNKLRDYITFPEVIATLSTIQIIQVACGRKHTLVLTKDGTVLSFGCAENGRLGYAGPEEKSMPQIQAAPRRVELPDACRGTFVACGATFSGVIARLRDAKQDAPTVLFTFGKRGPWLGHGLNVKHKQEDKKAQANVRKPAAEAASRDSAKCDGVDLIGEEQQPGRLQEDIHLPARVHFDIDDEDCVQHLACGETHCIATMKSGSLFTWGVGEDGKLGHVFSTHYADQLQRKSSLTSAAFLRHSNHEKKRSQTTQDQPFFRSFQDMEDVFVDEKETHHAVILRKEQAVSLVSKSKVVKLASLHQRSDATAHEEGKDESTLETGTVRQPSTDMGYQGPFEKTVQLAHGMMVGMFDAENVEPLENLVQDDQEMIFVIPDFSDVWLPRAVLLLRGFHCSSAAAGRRHSLVLDREGRIFAFGQNKEGQLGLGSEVMSNSSLSAVPVPVQVITNAALFQAGAVKVECGSDHSIALGKDTRLYSWGSGATGREGDPTRPELVSFEGAPLSSVKDVACGEAHTICCTNFGHVFGFGSNCSGQLGSALDRKAFDHPVLIQNSASANSFFLQESNFEERVNSLKPEKDTTLIISSVSAGGGLEPNTGHSVLLSCSLLSDNIWDKFNSSKKPATTTPPFSNSSSPTDTPDGQQPPFPWLAGKTEKTSRNFCVAWPSTSSSSPSSTSSSFASDCIVM